jgi:hypothetical protein
MIFCDETPFPIFEIAGSAERRCSAIRRIGRWNFGRLIDLKIVSKYNDPVETQAGRFGFHGSFYGAINAPLGILAPFNRNVL